MPGVLVHVYVTCQVYQCAPVVDITLGKLNRGVAEIHCGYPASLKGAFCSHKGDTNEEVQPLQLSTARRHAVTADTSISLTPLVPALQNYRADLRQVMQTEGPRVAHLRQVYIKMWTSL